MPNRKRVSGTTDSAPRSLYAKRDVNSEYAYPLVATSDGSLNINVVEGFDLPDYDTIDLLYTGSNLALVVYQKASVTQATLTLTYSGATLIKVVKG